MIEHIAFGMIGAALLILGGIVIAFLLRWFMDWLIGDER